MAHNSSENLIQSDSSTSTDELNNGSHSRSEKKVSKKMFHKKKTAFVDGANSVTSQSSSVPSSPQQHPIIVVGEVDVHHPRLPSPKPLPRKQLMTPVQPIVAKRKHFFKVDDILDISGESESNNSERNENVVKREDIELSDIKSQSESSGVQSNKTEEQKMFFARSRKNTIVTNIDEVSISNSNKKDKLPESKSKSSVETSKPSPKPSQNFQIHYDIVDEKPTKKRLESFEKYSSNESSYSELSSKVDTQGDSETLTEDELSKHEKETTVEKANSYGAKSIQNKIIPNNQHQKLIGIYIHSSSEIKYDYNIHRPVVRCSIIDATTQLIQGSKINIANKNQQIELNKMIPPVMTKGCHFASSNKFQCRWEELLLINEDISSIIQGDQIIFFEILDTPSTESKNTFIKLSKTTDEWHYVCWGFLKLGDGINYSNVDKRSCLQLFRYQRGNWFRKYSLNVYDQFRLDRIKYPATLNVTIKGITTVESQSDLFKGENELLDLENHLLTERTPTESKKVTKFTNMKNIQSNLLRRLPGQYPNMIYKTHLIPSSKGSLVSKFSPNGQLLAYSTNSDYNIQIATVPDLKVINTLRGHTNFIYDLDWLTDKGKNSFPLHLVSASSDRTAMVWTIEKDRVSLTILPHPSFLYAAKFLVNLTIDECSLFAVTGGRDCVMRVWKITENSFDLLQELVEHQNYITSITCSTKACKFYSSDWNGCILEWSNEENSNMFHVTRKFPQLSEGILTLHLHPKNELRLYPQLKGLQIHCLDVGSEVVLNTLGLLDHDSNTRNFFTISPCGSTIYTVQWNTIFFYNILTGTVQGSFQIPSVTHRKSYISHLDYHPKLFLLSVAVYGANGEVVLLSHKSDTISINNNEQSVHENSSDSRWMLLKENVHSRSSELLGNIIQRIDDIFHQPKQHKNETDDFKKKNIVHLNQRKGDSERCHIDYSELPVEVETLEILSESDSESSVGSGGTFTIRSGPISEVSNRTFILNKSSNKIQEQVNDGTYNIEVGNNSDDTTISESM